MWLIDWTYRKSHIILPASGAGQNYQKRIIVHYGAGVNNDENVYLDGKCKSDFGDIRFTNSTGVTLLDYWIEKQIDSDYAICWIKITEDLNVYDTKIYIYYGNTLATSVANGDNTFIFFDDFENGLNKWVTTGKQEGIYTALANQHKMVQTSDGTIHTISISCFNAGSGTSSINMFSSRDLGITWEILNVRQWTPGQLNFPSIAKDSNDNLYITYGYLAGGADGKIRFKKAIVNKTNPILWTWSLGSEISIDATITDGGVPDIMVDLNNYVHVVYCRTLLNKSRWARSIDGGTTWVREEITIPGGVNQGYMVASIDKDSQNNLYFGMAPLFVSTRNFKFYIEKVNYLGSATWLQSTPVEVSSDVSTIGQLNVLPDDRICAIYGLKNNSGVYFRKTTLPRDITTWDSEVFIGESSAEESRNSSLSFADSDNLKVVFLSPLLHPTTFDIALTESSDGGITWSVPTLLTDSPIPSRYPASLRTTILGNMFFVWGDYTDWEAKYSNLWFRSTGESNSILVYGSSPVVSTDYAYSGEKSVRFSPLIMTIIQKIGGPTTNHAVHVHYYDQMSPLTESAIFSFDGGEAEESFIGVINDVAQYEYLLDGVNYNSGIDRTVGWHEFVSRMSPNLKEFLIDGNLMPITGVENYGAIILLTSTSLNQVNTYWDSIFETKFVNPEPTHGTWGIEETGIIPFIVEDIIKLNNHNQLILEDIINILSQKSVSAEDTISILSLSSHIPFSSEDILFALSALRTYMVTKEFITNEGAFPIIGGKHLIDV